MIELREEVAISPSGLFQISFPTWVGVPGCALVVAPLSISFAAPICRHIGFDDRPTSPNI